MEALWENIFHKDKKDTAVILKNTVLFQELSAKELRFVTSIVHIRTYRQDETVFRQGETGYGMYIIAAGGVDIVVQQAGPGERGDEPAVLVTRLGGGDFFGELALVEENGRRSATAIARRDTRLIGFFKPNLFDILERKPAMGVKILLGLSKVLGLRLIETNQRISSQDDRPSAPQPAERCG